MNMNIAQWKKYHNCSFGIVCSSCDIGCANTMLPNGCIVKTCNCGIERTTKHFENRKNKILNKCGECDMFYMNAANQDVNDLRNIVHFLK